MSKNRGSAIIDYENGIILIKRIKGYGQNKKIYYTIPGGGQEEGRTIEENEQKAFQIYNDLANNYEEFRANFNYIDDLGRTFSGYRSFGFSRYMSDFLSQFIHGSGYITDIFPYTQLIAIVFISLASTIVIKLLTMQKHEDKVNLWYIFATIPIGLSPYFLENFSYQ